MEKMKKKLEKEMEWAKQELKDEGTTFQEIFEKIGNKDEENNFTAGYIAGIECALLNILEEEKSVWDRIRLGSYVRYAEKIKKGIKWNGKNTIYG